MFILIRTPTDNVGQSLHYGSLVSFLYFALVFIFYTIIISVVRLFLSSALPCRIFYYLPVLFILLQSLDYFNLFIKIINVFPCIMASSFNQISARINIIFLNYLSRIFSPLTCLWLLYVSKVKTAFFRIRLSKCPQNCNLFSFINSTISFVWRCVVSSIHLLFIFAVILGTFFFLINTFCCS